MVDRTLRSNYYYYYYYYYYYCYCYCYYYYYYLTMFSSVFPWKSFTLSSYWYAVFCIM